MVIPGNTKYWFYIWIEINTMPLNYRLLTCVVVVSLFACEQKEPPKLNEPTDYPTITLADPVQPGTVKIQDNGDTVLIESSGPGWAVYKITGEKIDTVRGKLVYYEDSEEQWNSGQRMCDGYWIGKGLMRANPFSEFLFIPGLYMADHGRYLNESDSGGFYDYQFNKVSAKNVYALIKLRR